MANQSPCFVYDVFLNFRGPDTRRRFVDHLYRALVESEIKTFRDEYTLEGGQRIETIFQAISESKIFVPIFSENYAESAWCLRELTHMAESKCVRPILPVFYYVRPTDVRNQTGPFSKAFQDHARDNGEKVGDWRKALGIACGRKGYEVPICGCRDEGQTVKKIVKGVRRVLTAGGAREADLTKMISFVNWVLTQLDDKDSEQETERKIRMLVKSYVSQDVVETTRKASEKIMHRINTKNFGNQGEEKIGSVVEEVSREEMEKKLVNLIYNVRHQLKTTSKEEAQAKLVLVVRNEMTQPPSEETYEEIKQKVGKLLLRVVTDASDIVHGIIDLVYSVGDLTIEAVEATNSAIEDALEDVETVASEFCEETSEAVEVLANITGEALEQVGEGIENATVGMGEFGEEALHVIGTGVDETVEGIDRFAKNCVDVAREVTEGFSRWFDESEEEEEE